MLMMLFFTTAFFMFLCLLGYPHEIMTVINKNWKNILLILSLIVNIILTIWIREINKSKSESEFKIKQYNILIKQQDSIIKESIKLQEQLAEKGNKQIDTIFIYQTVISKEIDNINKLRNEKDEAVKTVEYLNPNTIDKLFDSLAREYRLSKKGLRE